ncbi:bacillithiol system redox-active protein YtxJ [Paenibacillus sp. Marseille-Q4541]|uniref:bacillithiol system redox-active protein YtxJ n=1 Tax=Paenibacillus sp. Marseille-Q4541 TaxID=2831522 RepID=UPI001BAADEFC|nr:bacillithiol system redox-active protein YtxJ [Paenibacillus sp. Marseille-Q4541]
MKTLTRMTSIEQLNDGIALSSEVPLLLFKHSTRCPISAHAYDEVLTYLQGHPADKVNYSIIYVVEERSISMEAAERLGVRHESPQAILVKNGSPVWHTSHSHITSSGLSAVLSES